VSVGARALFFTETLEAWASDGTTAGTVRLASEAFEPAVFASGRTLAYLIAGEPFAARLWATDGTREGTLPITSEIVLEGSPSQRPRFVVPGTDRLFFTASAREMDPR